MSRKRRMFDIDVPEETPEVADLPPEIETKSATPGRRRGPMATAIGETGDALRYRKAIEADIRAENDALAHEFVRLKGEGLITDLVPIDLIDTHKLTRDRARSGDLELAELKASLREVGLSNPIRVESVAGGRYELVEGLRRLSAYRELSQETGNPKWDRIPAGMVAAGQGAAALYRRMVDENLIRKGVSFAEMAALALAYADERVEGCSDVDEAVNRLYASVGPQKRSYIRRFALVLRLMDKHLSHAPALPRSLGLKLADRIEGAPEALKRIIGALREAPDRTAEEEVAILRRALERESAPLPAKTRGAPKAARRGRVGLSVPVGPGVRCTATDGKMEMRADMDFAAVDRDKLERAIEAFFTELGR
ncbi:ParB/RepB/Spo0J family partition protein [Jannaschia pohangensis]|uniref:Chromosome partitioning protein, ParB family n=1 Tax=Jannaschia pohangensis TaxID=390807 RepID=A0A1I3UUN6_9RHOB|nr:ParB N-terminal domain-containing protein [Jannaschia pohangensis]SFJ85816.1 chromosome partitioning protein, ParB family [Jannaschia pohangensis]